MASRSSQRKSDSSLSRDDVSALLRDGATVRHPSEELLRSAKHLKSLGLLTFMVRQFVRCADPQDGDFRYARNRHCSGRIFLDDGLDESGHDFRCPECERPVFPHRSSKRRHPELRVVLNPQGIHAFVAKRLSGVGRVRDVCTGVFGIDVDRAIVYVCVVDICGDSRYLAREHARVLPTLYLCVDECGGDDRLLNEDWLASLRLADVVCGVADISERISDLARQGPPSSMQNLSVAVYQSGPPPIRLADSSDRRAANAAAPSDEEDVITADGVVSPHLLRLNGRDHVCDLTDQEIAFLNVALLQDLTPLSALMNGTHGAVWQEPYSESKRPTIRSMLKRVNETLSNASPPVPIGFGLLRGQNFVERRKGSTAVRVQPGR